MALFEYSTSETRPQYDMEDYFVFTPNLEIKEKIKEDQYEFDFGEE